MARPAKDKADRKSVHLRIPVTEEQRKLIMRAAQVSDLDMAAWARPILLREAQKVCRKVDERK
jgi:uncharacterized protein (DUF1778 family)